MTLLLLLLNALPTAVLTGGSQLTAAQSSAAASTYTSTFAGVVDPPRTELHRAVTSSGTNLTRSSVGSGTRAEVYEFECVTILDQISKNDGSWLVPSDVDGSIELQVTRAGERVDFLELEPSDVLQVAPVLDGYWETDNIGYTFLHNFDTGTLPLVGGRKYRLIYTIPLLLSMGNKYVVMNLRMREVESQDTHEST